MKTSLIKIMAIQNRNSLDGELENVEQEEESEDFDENEIIDFDEFMDEE